MDIKSDMWMAKNGKDTKPTLHIYRGTHFVRNGKGSNFHIADLISNIIRGACYGTTYVSLFNNSLFSIMKCARSIPVVHASFYSLSELCWETGPGTSMQWSIG